MSDNKILASIARVVDVIVDESHPFFRNYGDIGAIRYRLLDSSGKESDLRSLDLAYPIDRNIMSFPLAGEVVQLFIGPKAQDVVDQADTSKIYYGSSIAIWNHPHYNAHPDPGLREGDPNPGPGVIERGDIYPMLPFMGDVLIEGRHGQSIRMTGVRANQQLLVNDQNNGKPLTIIRNGQKETKGPQALADFTEDGYTPRVEDINDDRTSIYLTSDHIIPLFPSSDARGSLRGLGPLNTDLYRGAQAIINSDRVVLNARKDSVLLAGNDYVHLTARNTHLDAEKRIVLDAPKIFLGEYAFGIENSARRVGESPDNQEPAVLGGQAETILLAINEAMRTLSEAMSKVETPDLWIDSALLAAESVKKSLENIDDLIRTELKSKKVFITPNLPSITEGLL